MDDEKKKPVISTIQKYAEPREQLIPTGCWNRLDEIRCWDRLDEIQAVKKK